MLLEFTDWKKLDDPVPETTCFSRKMIQTGGEYELKSYKVKEVRCHVCEGAGVIKKYEWNWFEREELDL